MTNQTGLIILVVVAFVGGYFIVSKLFDMFSPKRPKDSTTPNRNEDLDTSFFDIFSMLGKMAACESKVSDRQAAIIDEFITHGSRLGAERRTQAQQIIQTAPQSLQPFEFHARRFAADGRDPALLSTLLRYLESLADADGQRTLEENRLIATAIEVFGVSS
ncbi:MAG: TerB family tellurite resistance protein [Kiritimatiellia bacterium]|jgi:hypothetical protein|nr:TerB family tellurite resistance protein [Kiritimatiellia bacterium]MDP6848176.1 TerB family tellurite resistance protein [Kiritimatiellia bacterium]